MFLCDSNFCVQFCSDEFSDLKDRIAEHGKFGGFLTMAVKIARSHHERFGGSSYPDGLSGQWMGRLNQNDNIFKKDTQKWIIQPNSIKTF